MIIKGVAHFHREKKKHLITLQTVRTSVQIKNRALTSSRNTNAC